jgi:hypothetical protein
MLKMFHKENHKLTEKGRKFEWTNECQSPFEELKNRLVSSPILAHPDFSKKFILDTDASNEAILAMILQFLSFLDRQLFLHVPNKQLSYKRDDISLLLI